MLQVYEKDNTNFENNGDYTLIPSIAKLKVSLNGICEVEMEHTYDEDGRWKAITEESIISGPTPWSNKQLFRVYNIVKDMFSIRIFARHIFFDLANYILLDTRPTLKNGQEALNIILANTPFTAKSNISTVSTAYYIRKNIVEAISSDEQAFLNRWGGEILWDNYTVNINSNIGSDRGVAIEYGKNLLGAEEDINTSNVVTRIIPTGFNGIMLDGTKPWVDSSNINKYPTIKQRVINFSDVKVKENPQQEDGFNTIEEARAELIKKCNSLFKDGIDSPVINIKVAMENLSDKEEYKEYKVLEEVQLGDTVACKNSNIGIDTKARCISYEWDMISETYLQIELGSQKEDYFSKQNDIMYKASNVLNDNGTIKAETLEGTINSLQTQLRAMKDIAQKQHVRAMLFEDLETESPTFGAMCIGTMGFEIANQRTADNRDWNWRTFGTGKGFTADEITAGILKAITLQSLDGSCSINLNSGIIEFAKGIIKGKNITFNLDSGELISRDTTDPNNIKEIIITSGGINSSGYVNMNSMKGLILMCNAFNGGGDIAVYDWGSYIGGKKINILAGYGPDSVINLTASKVYVNDTDIVQRVANLENIALTKEGLI